MVSLPVHPLLKVKSRHSGIDGGLKILTKSNRELAFGLVVLGLLGAITSFFPISDSNDDWWHLKAGKLLWEGDLGWYSTDPFTESAKEKMWVNHEWLAEMVLYGAYMTGGLRSAILLKTLILIAAFGIVFWTAATSNPRCRLSTPQFLAATLAVALAIPSSQFTFYIRPPIFTFLLLAIYHHSFFVKAGAPPDWKTGAGLALLMALWANLHGGAILGCVIVFLMWVGCCLDYMLNSAMKTDEQRRSILRWIYFGIAIGVASLMNPYGFHLHLLTLEMMSQKWLTQRIAEMLPPRFDFIWTLPLLLVPATWGVFRYGGWGQRLVFLFLLWQGMAHVRHLPLLSIWAAPYAGLAFVHCLKRPTPLFLTAILAIPILLWGNLSFQVIPMTLLGSAPFRFAVVLLLLAFAIGILLRPRALSHLFLVACSLAIGFVVVYPGNRPPQFIKALKGVEWEGENYPNRLIDLVIDFDIPGQVLLNRENHSGYTIWRLAPERMRTFTCSRFDLQGSLPRMELETLLWCVTEAWVDDVSGNEIRPWKELWEDKYHFDLVILEKYSDRAEPYPFPLWTYLGSPESSFVQVASEVYPNQPFRDQIFSLFVRKGPELERIMKTLKNRPLLRDSD